MQTNRWHAALLAGTGLVLVLATPALAEECAQRLDQVEQKLSSADLPEARRDDIRQVIQGARTLVETGDEQGCMNVVAELDDLTGTLEESGKLPATAAGSQPSGQAGGQEEMAQAGQPAGDAQPTPAAGAAAPAATLKIQQPQPKVTVRQQPPKITINIPPPIVTIEMPKPEISVDMPEPEVTVEMSEPQVSLNQPETEETAPQQAQIEVQRAEPQVEVKQAEPEVRIQQAKGTGSDQAQPMAAAGEQAGQGQKEQMAGTRPPPQAEQDASGEQTDPGQQQAAEQPTPQGRETTAVTGVQQEAAKQQAPATAQGQEKQPSESPLAALPASEVIGAEVMNAQGDQVAKIVDLVKTKGGDALNVVLSVGGFLGIGDKKVALPLDRFDVTPDNKVVLASVSEDELKSMPKYDEDAYERVAGEQSKSETMPAQQQ